MPISRTVFGLLLGALVAPVGAIAQEQERVEEIVVTGQKIVRSIQDTPASVAVVTAEAIETQNIIDLKDVIDRTANLTTQEGSRFTIRGIDSLNVSGAGLADLATIYVDGSPLPRDATLAGPLDVWDLEQIEVFRGPQSTLQGRNALAGAVIINTASPEYNWSGRTRLMFGNEENERRLAAAIGGPIVDDQLAFRFSAEKSDADGLVRNVTVGGFEDEREALMLRGKLLYEPAAIEDLRIQLAYTYDEREFGELLSSLAVDDPANNRVSFANRRFRDNVELGIGVITVDYAFSDSLSLTSISAINVTERSFESDGDRTPEEIEFSFFDSKTTTLTQETRLNFDNEKFSGTVGFYYANIDTPDSLSDAVINLDVINDLGLINVLVGGFGLDLPTAQFVGSFYADPVSIRAQADNPIDIESYALFTDFSYYLNDRWTLFGGLRFDNESQQIITGNNVSIVSDLPDPGAVPAPLAPVIAGVNQFLISQALDATSQPAGAESPSFSAFLPKLGIGFDIDDSKSLNFTVQRGYRSGGVGINAARAESFDFDEEFIWNYEFAFRSQWLNDALTVNANVFFIDWEDQQVNIQLSENVFDRETQNAGSSQIYGFEVETAYRVSNNLDFYGSIGYAESEFEDFSVNVGGSTLDLAGNEFAFSPQWTLATGVTWRSANGWIANGNANYSSSAFARADRPQSDRLIDERILVNFRAGWENETYGIYVTGDNLLDEEYVLSLIPNDPLLPSVTPEFARFGAPRTLGVQLEARF